MGLHVGVFRSKEFLGAIDGELFDLVRVFAATVVALARIAFSVLVREDGAHSFEDGFGDEIFRGDEFQPRGLAPGFVAKEAGDLRIDGIQRAVHAVVGGCGLTHSDASFARAICRQGVGREGILSDGVGESQFRSSCPVTLDLAEEVDSR
jgi:hypothetical protein